MADFAHRVETLASVRLAAKPPMALTAVLGVLESVSKAFGVLGSLDSVGVGLGGCCYGAFYLLWRDSY